MPTLSMTTGRTELSPSTSWYVRQLIEKYRTENNATDVEVAKLLGQTKQHVGAIRNGKANPGLGLALAVAKMVGVTYEQLQSDGREAWAAEFGEDANGPKLERPERYPNRAAVLTLLRKDLDAEVVRRVESRMLSSPSDMPRIWWVRAIINEIQNVELEREQPAAAEAKLSESERLSEAANNKIEARRKGKAPSNPKARGDAE